MAKKKNAARSSGAPATERSSPLVPNALLWIGFLAILAIGVVTVFVPEVTDEGGDEEDGAAATEAPVASDDGTEPAPAPPAAP